MDCSLVSLREHKHSNAVFSHVHPAVAQVVLGVLMAWQQRQTLHLRHLQHRSPFLWRQVFDSLISGSVSCLRVETGGREVFVPKRPQRFDSPPIFPSQHAMAAVERVKGNVMDLQAEQGMKLLQATVATGAEYDTAGAEAYRKEVEAKVAKLEMEATQLTGKDNKKERSAKGKEVADLKNEHKYVDACKVVKGLEPKFGHFITKEAELPKIDLPETVQEAAPEKAKKEHKKKEKAESAGLSPDELKELENLKQQIVEEKGGSI